MRTLVAAALLLGMPALALAQGPDETEEAPAAEGRRPRTPRRAAQPSFDAQVRGELGTGGFDGWLVRRDRGALAYAGVDATLGASWGRFRLELPLEVAHRQTLGASLSESRGRAGAELGWRMGPRLRLSAHGALAGAWRPDWPDLYQPLPDGTYAPTSRFSELRRELGVQVAGIPLRHHHARLKYRYQVSDTPDDPAFDPLLAPMHLTPRDGDRHELSLGWRFLGEGFKVGGGASAFTRQDFFLYARDAATGRTHTAPGGVPSNPLQSLRGVELSVEGEVALLDGGLVLGAGYGHELVQDTFEGYYSSQAHHPEVKLEARLGPQLTGTLKGSAWLRDYGPDSYAAGRSHPALTFGTHRVDQRGDVGAELRWALTPHVSTVLEGRWRVRRTNFPSYVPGVFPSTRSYSIDWSYQNLLVQTGLEFRP